MNDFPSSRFDRGKLMAKAGIKVGGNYAKYHLKKALRRNGNDAEAKRELHRSSASELFSEFSKLRGTALKLAQGLSLDSAIMPEEFAEVMTQAQYSVPPISRILVNRIIKNELGDLPESLFEEFSPEAVAAASLGQVHRATGKNGEQLAVKVQYPNLRETIDSDISMARLIFDRIVKSPKADEYFAEVRNKLMEETDYQNEGRQISDFHARYSSDRFATPEWRPDLSTERVLTMTWLQGRHLNEFLKSNPTQEERNHFGQLMWDFFHEQINDSYTVHADAHPGNFLLLDDGRLGVLDFGCVKVCPEDFFKNYMRLFLAHRDQDREEMIALYKKLEILEKRPEEDDEERAFYEYTLELGKYFVSPYKHDFFDFGDDQFRTKFNGFARDSMQFREPRGSRHFIFVARAHLGLYQMLMKIRAKVDVRPGRKRLYEFLEAQELV